MAEFAVEDGSPAKVTDATFAAFLARLADEAAGRLPAGKVAATQLWLVER